MQIKAADDRPPDIVALERLLDRSDLPGATRKRIETEIRNIRAGAKGERDAAYEIELWFGRSPNWATIHDLRIEVDGLVAQIDHLIINRLAEVWVCESKSFAEGVSVNEHGEWTRWWNGRPDGIPSPIQQNRRHIHLLGRAFDDGLVKAPRRLGIVPMKPAFRSLVVVSNGARIGQPKRKVDGLDQVIKAEVLKTRLSDEFDKVSEWRLGGLIGKEGLMAFAEDLAALHRRSSVDWAGRFGLAQAPAEPGPSVVSRPLAPVSVGRRPVGNQSNGGACARCGSGVSESVVRYCEQHVDAFAGVILCLSCQSVVRTGAEPPVPRPDWHEVLARYHTPTRLETVARKAPFIVVANGEDLRVLPDSSGRGRTLTRADFERAAPLLGRQGRAEVNEANQASRNSSYVGAIIADLRRPSNPELTPLTCWRQCGRGRRNPGGPSRHPVPSGGSRVPNVEGLLQVGLVGALGALISEAFRIAAYVREKDAVPPLRLWVVSAVYVAAGLGVLFYGWTEPKPALEVAQLGAAFPLLWSAGVAAVGGGGNTITSGGPNWLQFTRWKF